VVFLTCLLYLFSCPVRYKFDTEFEREIKSEVFKIVRRGKEFGTPGYFFRAMCYISFFFYLQLLWVSLGTSFNLAIIYGVSMAFIGLNVQHDANHGAASRKTWVNDLLGLGADFIGGCKWLWMEKHWTVRRLVMSHELVVINKSRCCLFRSRSVS
jgi:fatty acid desaturase (delta-4 desaturase)